MGSRFGAWCTIAAAPMLAVGLGRLAVTAAPGALSGGAQSGAALSGGAQSGGAQSSDAWLSSLIGLTAAAVGALASAYLTVAAAALIVAHLRVTLAGPMRGGRRGRAAGDTGVGLWVPAAWRRVVAGALGIAVATGIALPAAANDEAPAGCAPGLAEPGIEAACADTPTPLLPSVAGVTLPDIADDVATGEQAGPPAAPVAEATTPLAPTEPTAPVVLAEPPMPPEQNPPDGLAPGDSAAGDAAPRDPALPEQSQALTPATDQAPVQSPVPTPTQPPAQSQAAPQTQAPASAYVVQPGDSLWSITEALLGEDASDAEIAQAWPSLYAANMDAIGTNASLIFPGTVLAVPAGLAS